MAKTINLNKKELADLIVEIYKELTDDKFVWNAMQKAKYDNWKNLDEQAYIEDDIAYLDPNQPMSANIKELTRLQQEMKTRIGDAAQRYPGAVKAVSDGDVPWYADKHVWLDILAAILYIAGAITSGAGVGVILLYAAVIVDLFNAYLYYQEEDYFMAGLQASFVIIPGVNLAYLKAIPGMRSGLKALSKVANTAFKKGVPVSLKEIHKTVGRKTTELLAKGVNSSAGKVAMRGLKTTKNTLTKIINAFDDFIDWLVRTNRDWLYDYLIPDWVISAVKGLRGVLKVIKQVVILALAVFAELSIYDPSTAANLLDLVGFKNAAEWFRKQPKYGLNLWNKVLENAGNYKGAMTTVPYECRGTVYTWDEIVSAFQAEEKYSNRDSASERRIWEKWTQDNWRPKVGGDIGAETWYGIQQIIELHPELEQELNNINAEIMESCYNFSKAYYEYDEVKGDVAEIIQVAGDKL